MASLSIGELARAAGIGVETVRFYERQGLIPDPPRRASGYRMYPPGAIDRLRFIRRARDLGFSLSEINDLLSLAGQPEGDRGRVKRIAEGKLAEVEGRIRDLQNVRTVLAHLTAQCSGHGPVHDCPIIESLTGEPMDEEHH
jgi:Hg(II)-responsive transcriptional regulator